MDETVDDGNNDGDEDEDAIIKWNGVSEDQWSEALTTIEITRNRT